MLGWIGKILGRGEPAPDANREPEPMAMRFPVGRKRSVIDVRPQKGKRGRWRWAARFATDKEPYCVMEIRGVDSEAKAIAHALILTDAEIRVYDANGRRVVISKDAQ